MTKVIVKKNLQFVFTLKFVTQVKKNKNGDPRNGRTPVVLRNFFFSREGLVRMFSLHWVYYSSIPGQVLIHFSSFLSLHDMKIQSEISPIKV